MTSVIITNVAPMRAGPDTRAEQVSQALLGETVAVREERAGFVHCECADGYTGWVRATRLRPLASGEDYPAPGREAVVRRLFVPVLRQPAGRAERIALLSLGSRVETGDARIARWRAVVLPDGTPGWVAAVGVGHIARPARRAGRSAARWALTMIGVPYLWGGRSAFGVDCSGLTQLAYGLCGIGLPRDAYQQAAWNGLREVARTDLAMGDLVFFGSPDEGPRRGITHVALMLDGRRMVHASGAAGVVVGEVDAPPYSEMFRCARRLRAELR